MAESPTFEWCAEAVEERTSLDRLAARGTVRLALRKSGLNSHSVTTREMTAVLQRVMPVELLHRGVEEAAALCEQLVLDLGTAELEEHQPQKRRPEDVFRRFFGEPDGKQPG